MTAVNKNNAHAANANVGKTAYPGHHAVAADSA